jgi:Zn-dependent protease
MPPSESNIILASLLVIFLSITVHEYAHAAVANAAGDDTARLQGRVTLNPFAHFDVLGAAMIVITTLAGFGIGWGKPVPMQPSRMKNPKWDHFAAVAAGPLSNLIIAGVCSILLRVLGMGGMLHADSLITMILLQGVVINVVLFLFNLLPMGPLDGMWLLGTFLPDRVRWAWTRWNLTAGSLVLLGMILIGQLSPSFSIIGRVLRPFGEFLLGVLLGQK